MAECLFPLRTFRFLMSARETDFFIVVYISFTLIISVMNNSGLYKNTTMNHPKNPPIKQLSNFIITIHFKNGQAKMYLIALHLEYLIPYLVHSVAL